MMTTKTDTTPTLSAEQEALTTAQREAQEAADRLAEATRKATEAAQAAEAAKQRRRKAWAEKVVADWPAEFEAAKRKVEESQAAFRAAVAQDLGAAVRAYRGIHAAHHEREALIRRIALAHNTLGLPTKGLPPEARSLPPTFIDSLNGALTRHLLEQEDAIGGRLTAELAAVDAGR